MTQAIKYILCVICGFAVGCSQYQFGQGKRSIPGGYDKIAIPMFQNKTPEVGIESYFTESLRTEFDRSSLATVVSKNEAQFIIEGTIVSVEYGIAATTNNSQSDLQNPNPITYPVVATPSNPNPATIINPLPDNTILTKQYSTNLTVELVARKVSDNSVMWRGTFTGQRQYLAPLIGSPILNSANPLYNQSSRVDMISRMAKEMMSEAHDRLTENF